MNTKTAKGRRADALQRALETAESGAGAVLRAVKAFEQESGPSSLAEVMKGTLLIAIEAMRDSARVAKSEAEAEDALVLARRSKVYEIYDAQSGGRVATVTLDERDTALVEALSSRSPEGFFTKDEAPEALARTPAWRMYALPEVG